MRIFDGFTKAELPLARIAAFSDGVFAIVAALPVLDLGVPKLHHTDNIVELKFRLLVMLPKFLSWIIGLVILAKFWLNHQHLFGLTDHADYATLWLNSIFLILLSLTPFSTALMGRYPENSLAVSIFGVLMALESILLIALQGHVVRYLMRPGLVETRDRRLFLKSLVTPILFLAGAVAGWWLTADVAFTIYFLTPLFFIVPKAPRIATPVGFVRSEAPPEEGSSE